MHQTGNSPKDHWERLGLDGLASSMSSWDTGVLFYGLKELYKRVEKLEKKIKKPKK